jgi:hypothetical protein
MRYAASFLNSLLLLVFLTGCNTVAPKPVADHAYSWDGNDFNSGLVGKDLNGYIITAHARDRYNALVELYGGYFSPPIEKDYGITSGPQESTFYIAAESLVDFINMNQDRKSGKMPFPGSR